MSRLLAAISPHGFGHLAQSAAVLNAFHVARPDVALTLRTDLPRAALERRIHAPFELQPVADDFGMAQHSALAVDVAASAARYRDWHANWDRRVTDVAADLARAGADLVLADIPYLTLAGAARAGIPALALCCLNWADIYRHYCAERPGAGAILAQMEAAYNSAELFLRTRPAMPMPFLDNAREIGPVMTVGSSRREELNGRFGIEPGDRLVLVATGGIPLRLPMEAWPSLPGVRYVVPPEWQVTRHDSIPFDRLGLAFSDVLASADLLLTKPGYGSFTEAAGCGVPVLYVPREDWPESAYLEAWLRQVVPCESITLDALGQGGLGPPLERLLQGDRRPPVAPSGVARAVAELSARCSG